MNAGSRALKANLPTSLRKTTRITCIYSGRVYLYLYTLNTTTISKCKTNALNISHKLFYNIYLTYKLRKLGFTNKSDRFLYRITQAWHVEKKWFYKSRDANMESLEHLEDKLQR